MLEMVLIVQLALTLAMEALQDLVTQLPLHQLLQLVVHAPHTLLLNLHVMAKIVT